ncbi:hypothetical protein ACT3CE_01025 [Marinifilum sp. RC60d5]|uniref:hypothetical protein n=1 Tax=Marinifilum sp. RC60d5 TaxID=3458414 RepID=UPI00403560C5
MHRLKAYRRKGFGIHSPYTFYLVTNVIEAKLHYYAFAKLKNQRKAAIKLMKALVKKQDTDSTIKSTLQQELKRLSSGESVDRLIFRLLNFSKAKFPMYIGRDIAYTAAYMAMVDSRNKIKKVETYSQLENIADEIVWNSLKINNVLKGSINRFSVAKEKSDFVVVSDTCSAKDLEYLLENYKNILTESCFLIVLNMYKTESMEKVWLQLKEKQMFRISLDLFHVGVLISRKGMQKQNYKRKYRF